MKKILLIEDDLIVRENTAEILTLAHYEVLTAEDGKKGVQLAQEAKPNLIVCDIMMPELDGYGVFHILFSDPETASIPFIFLTAKAEKSEVRKGMDLGADDYLTKPFEETELLNVIERRLRKAELLKKDYAFSSEGLNQFLEEARGMEELELLSQKSPIIHYKKKEMVFREEDVPSHLFFVNRGKIKTYQTHADGKEYLTHIYQKGEFFAYAPLLEGAAYSDSAVALEDSEVCKIPKSDFLALLYKNSDIANKFIRLLSSNVSEQEKHLLSLAYDTVRKRVAQAILLLIRHNPDPAQNSSRIALSRDDLASLAGTATETAIRCLSEFKGDHLIGMEGRNIVVLDREGLSRIH